MIRVVIILPIISVIVPGVTRGGIVLPGRPGHIILTSEVQRGLPESARIRVVVVVVHRIPLLCLRPPGTGVLLLLLIVVVVHPVVSLTT